MISEVLFFFFFPALIWHHSAISTQQSVARIFFFSMCKSTKEEMGYNKGKEECMLACLVASDSSVIPFNFSPPGFSVHGIFQARILEWVAIPL